MQAMLKQVSNGVFAKPLLITEFGLDSMDFRMSNGEVNQEMQASAITKLWSLKSSFRMLPCAKSK